MDVFIGLTNKYKEAFLSLLSPLSKLLSMTYFNFFSIDGNGRVIIMNPNLTLLRYYIDNQYYMYDPHVVHPENLSPGFALWSSYQNVHYQGKLLYELREIFNINSGVSLVQKDNNRCHIYSFGASKTNFYFSGHIFNNTTLLQQFTQHFYKETNKIIKEFYDNSINIVELKKDQFFSQPGITTNCLLTENNINELMHIINSAN